MKKLWGLAMFLIIAIGAINLKPAVKAGTGLLQEKTLTKPACAAGEAASGDLGYSGTECHGCVISGKHVFGEPDIEFDAEPILSDIRKDGPADGKLAEQDALVAIDGQDITTRAAAVQLSWLEPGKPVRLTVRRAGVLTDVESRPRPAAGDLRLRDRHSSLGGEGCDNEAARCHGFGPHHRMRRL